MRGYWFFFVAFLCACPATDPDVVLAAGPVAATAATPSLTEGSANSFSSDLAGNLRTSLGTLISGEDQTNNVLKVEGQFSYSGDKTSDTQVKASAGFVHNLVCIGTDAAATAGTIILYDNTAESGTVVMSWAVQAAAYAQPVVFPLDVVMATGIYLGFTTTADITCTVSYR